MGKMKSKSGESAAANRREEILEAAVAVFSEHGYYSATTAQVAERVGISQPYVFKFFKSKAELFAAALKLAFERIVRAFSGVDASSDRLEQAMIQTYEELMRTHHHEIVLQMQAMVIKEEPIRQVMREGIHQVTASVEARFREAGIAQPEVAVSMFMANGMLCNISAVLEMPELKPKHPKS
ncbi:TetR/AcrR family transcriptional regulator [Paenibacillus tyrfis]|uniref:TetR/AcrR family transcriptional regulator n=1 Tax=Paenibacillus tyrfis TaxID=1501230 RepID=UPI000B58C999|nr:TetR/AcrR family transcriptional regulator [Paenibacillus tyrfis]